MRIINLFHIYVLLYNHDIVSKYLRLLMSEIVYTWGTVLSLIHKDGVKRGKQRLAQLPEFQVA